MHKRNYRYNISNLNKTHSKKYTLKASKFNKIQINRFENYRLINK